MEDILEKSRGRPLRFMERLRLCIRQHGLAPRTEAAYVYWVKRYIRFYKLTHPERLYEKHVQTFLNDLQLVKGLSASTQRLALNALVFLYRNFLGRPLGEMEVRYSSKPRKLPVVLSRKEMAAVLAELPWVFRLVCRIMYGTGMRVSECVGLRVKDIDFDRAQIYVRGGKGNKDRTTLLPATLTTDLHKQLELCYLHYSIGLGDGTNSVYISASDRNRYPDAENSFAWQYLFPSPADRPDSETGLMLQQHLGTRAVHRRIKRAAKRAEINKTVSAHVFRHTFATELLESGTDIRTIQMLLGHSSVKTTLVYTHVRDRSHGQVVSPLDIAES